MYQVLARKYRPRNFNELVGQNHVSRALTSALDRGRLHHAYLFTGTRGVGKTTIARILAKCLNCETGVTSTPCETCNTCKAVNEGRFIDLIEIDAASRTKVEDTRELLDNVPYAPTQGRFKVYLIDEVHMLSTHSFNALLKTLEEPPAHVKFLFATTDPQKLPITVISRCLQFTLRPLAVDEITQHLTQILSTEQIESDQDALWQIGEAAQGSVRDALSLTDQAIAFGQGSIHHQDVKDMLGLIDRTIIYDLIAAIHQNQQQHVSQLLIQFRQQALDAALVLDQLISTLHELALMQYLPELSLKYSTEINQKITQLASMISAQDIQLYYQIACKGRADLQMAVTQEQGFEMTVLRLLAFRPLSRHELIAPAPSHPTAQITDVVTDDVAQPAAQDQVQDQAQGQMQVQPQVQEHVPHQGSVQVPVQTLASTPVMPAQLQTAVVDEPQATAVVESQVEIAETVSHTALETVAAPLQHAAELVADVPELSTFSTASAAPMSAGINVAALADQDAFFLDPLAAQQPQAEPTVDQVQADTLMAQPQHTPHVDLQIQASTQSPTQAPTPTAAQAATATQPRMPHGVMPQDILALKPQQLEGAWDVYKWEYWFRSSALPPAVQELAQQGIMTGQINGASVFHISPEYENLLAKAQLDLQNVLIAQWPQTRFSLDYEAIAETTPFMLQNQRKQQAYQCASDLLHQEPVLKKLINVFDGQLHNIQLK
ncbi:DNA polymerase-3 subunit gamma/tau [Acinetobacter calcoaceticus]|uniref:DNA polymerase III subunit gamma/tau n=1 Tax=Acinetobacter calcoaceticus TaxID=471 RepID=A0A4R1XTS3_ACICA|nr:DNA polymerase-3 subunit gamma/tau [Acinetobacter calcoaceticus]